MFVVFMPMTCTLILSLFSYGSAALAAFPFVFCQIKYLLKAKTAFKKKKKRLFSSALWINFVSGQKNSLKSLYTL